MKILVACFGILSLAAFSLSVASYSVALRTERDARSAPSLSRGDYESLLRIENEYETARGQQREQERIWDRGLRDPNHHGFATRAYPMAEPR